MGAAIIKEKSESVFAQYGLLASFWVTGMRYVYVLLFIYAILLILKVLLKLLNINPYDDRKSARQKKKPETISEKVVIYISKKFMYTIVINFSNIILIGLVFSACLQLLVWNSDTGINVGGSIMAVGSLNYVILFFVVVYKVLNN